MLIKAGPIVLRPLRLDLYRPSRAIDADGARRGDLQYLDHANKGIEPAGLSFRR